MLKLVNKVVDNVLGMLSALEKIVFVLKLEYQVPEIAFLLGIVLKLG